MCFNIVRKESETVWDSI